MQTNSSLSILTQIGKIGESRYFILLMAAIWSFCTLVFLGAEFGLPVRLLIIPSAVFAIGLIGLIRNDSATVTGLAHSTFAISFMLAGFLLFGISPVFLAVCGTIIAVAKEYWFDLTYEQNPPQTVYDSTIDFVEYLVGIVIGLLLTQIR